MGKNEQALTDAESERLTLLIEECSEVIKMCTKIKRFGYGTVHPNRIASNRARLGAELGHVNVIANMMMDAQDIHTSDIVTSMHAKRATIGQYLHFQT